MWFGEEVRAEDFSYILTLKVVLETYREQNIES